MAAACIFLSLVVMDENCDMVSPWRGRDEPKEGGVRRERTGRGQGRESEVRVKQGTRNKEQGTNAWPLKAERRTCRGHTGYRGPCKAGDRFKHHRAFEFTAVVSANSRQGTTH